MRRIIIMFAMYQDISVTVESTISGLEIMAAHNEQLIQTRDGLGTKHPIVSVVRLNSKVLSKITLVGTFF